MEYYIGPYIIRKKFQKHLHIESKLQVLEGYVGYDFLYIVLKYIKPYCYEYIAMK